MVEKMETITADTTIGRLTDIVRSVVPDAELRRLIGNGPSFTGTREECAAVTAELGARGIEWGWQ